MNRVPNIQVLNNGRFNANWYFAILQNDYLEIIGTLQEKNDLIPYDIEIEAKFCAGADYSGLAYSATLRQFARADIKETLSKIFQKHQQYMELLAGTPSKDASFAGNYTLRRSRTPDVIGVGFGQDGWELGLAFREPYLGVQVMRSKDELCK